MTKDGLAAVVKDDNQLEIIPRVQLMVRVNEKILGFKWMELPVPKNENPYELYKCRTK